MENEEIAIIKKELDVIVNRKGTCCWKWDKQFENPEENEEESVRVWVADMDFQIPKHMQEEFHKIVDHAVFGYPLIPKKFQETIQNHYKNNFGYEIPLEAIVKQSGSSTAFSQIIELFSEKGDYILLHTPAYHMVSNLIKILERKMLENPLKFNGKKYEIDFIDFEEKCKKFKPKMFVLVNPSNPTLRVFTKVELEKIVEICLKYNVFILSDEIFSDFTFGKHQHIPISTISKEIENNCIISGSASKCFNVSGLPTSFCIVINPDHRQKLIESSEKRGLNVDIGMIFGLQATILAYHPKGLTWLQAVKEYVWENYLFLTEFMKINIPKIAVYEPEGSYVTLLDFSKFNLSQELLKTKLLKSKVVFFDLTKLFGPYYLQRINLACSRKIIKNACEQLLNEFK